MKDNPFVSGIIPKSTVNALQVLAESQALTFSDMVKSVGLDHRFDLRHSDLGGTDLTDADLRGFDLTGADLRGASGVRVLWDKTTILDGADLSESIFAAKVRLETLFETDERAMTVLRAVSRGGWADQAVWAAKNLLSTGKYNDIAVPVVEALYFRAKDDFLKAELLRYLAPRLGSKRALREMLLAAVSDDPDVVTLVKMTFSLFRRHGMARDPAIRQIASSLIHSKKVGVREQAVQFIMRNAPSPAEVATVRNEAEAGDIHFKALYVGEIARSLGDEFDLITRDPETNSRFGMDMVFTPQLRDLVAQRWLRAESITERDQVEKPLALRRGAYRPFHSGEIAERAKTVSLMWQSLKEHGINFLPR